MQDTTGQEAYPGEADRGSGGEMSLIQHLTELKRRLLISICAVVLYSGITYYYADKIIELITKPAGKLYYMNPAEAFFTYLKVSFFAGFFISLTNCSLPAMVFSASCT